MRKTFYVKAIWDEEAKLFYSESDIIGLHIEAATLEDFQQIANDLAPDLIVENHIDAHDFAEKPLKEIIPAFMISQGEAAHC